MSGGTGFPLLDGLASRVPVDAASLLEGRESLCVVAPHPDDETLGCGVLLFEAQRCGLPSTVVCVTDGSRSHPRSKAWPARRLAAAREDELRAAVARLAPDAQVACLGYPDCGTPTDDDVTARRRLGEHLDGRRNALVLATWGGDPHADHAATSRLVRRAILDRPSARLLEYPIWGRFRRDLPADALAGAVMVLGSVEAQRAKAEALACHGTQMTRLIDDDPDGFVMEAWMQRHFVEHPELFLAA